jgi:hypothetical protein
MIPSHVLDTLSLARFFLSKLFFCPLFSCPLLYQDAQFTKKIVAKTTEEQILRSLEKGFSASN